MLFADEMPTNLLLWMWLWKIMLIAVVAGFSGMAVWVTIGGALDVRRMFARIISGHEEEKQRQNLNN